MSVRKTNPAFLNGIPEMLLLELLSRQAMHGYELVQTIRIASQGKLEFGEGCIYPILHRLESQKLLVAGKQTVAGRQRVVYRATAKGKAQLASSVDTWRQVVAAVTHAMHGGEHGRAALA
jgi:PadR family transcriptional regulator PadR